MKKVFTLRRELEAHPERVAKTQALTLNADKPYWGLKGTYGLFGSPEWWSSIESGAMPLVRYTGVIERAYVAGQDPDDINTVDIRLSDGTLQAVGIYLNDEADLALFTVGSMVSILYAMDELKQQPAKDGSVNVSKVALEMAVSLHPVAPPELASRPKFTECEYERAHTAYSEFKRKGHTELTCLRCGVGHFTFAEAGNSLEIRCETPNCLVERIRGI